MAKNILVINCDIRETRVCLIEDGIIAELHIERESQKGTLGNIYLGKVSRVLPGMQAAFIDIGLERAAFLHVEDLIRPADFDAYLAGHRAPAAANEDREVGITPEEAAADSDAPIEEGVAGPGAAPEQAFVAEDEESDTGEPVSEDESSDDDANDASSDDDASDDDDESSDDDSNGDDDASDDDDLSNDDDDDRSNDDDDRSNDDDAHSSEDDEADDRDDGEPEEDPSSDEPLFGRPASFDEAPAPIDAAIPLDDILDDGPLEEAAVLQGSSALEESTPLDEVARDEGAALDPAAAADEASGDDASATATRSRGRSRRGRVRRSGNTRDRAPIQAHDASGRGPSGRGTTSAEGGGAAQGATEHAIEASAPRASQDRGSQERGGRTRRGRSGEARPAAPDGDGRGRRNADKVSGRPSRSDSGRRDGRGGRSRDRDRRSGGRQKNDPLRVSKTTPIREVVREGQEVIVQVSKEPIGSKGARVTSHISLPGRYVVYLPTVEHIGISKRIGSEKERGRLREAIDAMKPPTGGLIVRTLAEGLTKKSLKADVGYLVRLWGEIAKGREGARAPEVLYAELDLILKTARDLFTDDIEKIVIDDREEYHRLRKFVEMFMPERANAIELYQDEEPIFDAYGIEDEIGRALARKVPLTSGGHLIIDQAEALTAIDVNTGRYIGKGSQDLEDTILKTNLEAVEEIAYQLRFRNIGGLIILDLIDMERAGNREKVRRRLEQLLDKDKAKTTLNRISDLGLIEMTRKRTRESLGRVMNEPCFYCDGTGHLQSKQTIAYEILRQISRERKTLHGYTVVVNAHPAVIDTLKNDEREAVQHAERLFTRRIELIPRKEYHIEQFDLQGK